MKNLFNFSTIAVVLASLSMNHTIHAATSQLCANLAFERPAVEGEGRNWLSRAGNRAGHVLTGSLKKQSFWLLSVGRIRPTKQGNFSNLYLGDRFVPVEINGEVFGVVLSAWTSYKPSISNTEKMSLRIHRFQPELRQTSIEAFVANWEAKRETLKVESSAGILDFYLSCKSGPKKNQLICSSQGERARPLFGQTHIPHSYASLSIETGSDGFLRVSDLSLGGSGRTDLSQGREWPLIPTFVESRFGSGIY